MGRLPRIRGELPAHEENRPARKVAWTAEEDEKLVAFIRKNKGHGSWRTFPKLAGLQRCGKSCRLRWTNYLRPDIKRGNISALEEHLIVLLHDLFGNKWATIATFLAGRTDNEVKNYWNTHLKKRFGHLGMNPSTHRPCQRRHCADPSSLLSKIEWRTPTLQQPVHVNSTPACQLLNKVLVSLQADARYQPATSRQAVAQNHRSLLWLQSPRQNEIPLVSPGSSSLLRPESMSSDSFLQEIDLPDDMINFDQASHATKSQAINLDADRNFLLKANVESVITSHDSYWSNLLNLVNLVTDENLGISTNDDSHSFEV